MSGVTLGELAQWADVPLLGDGAVRIDAVATLETAGEGCISFLANPRYRRFLSLTKASAIILHPDEAEHCPLPALLSENPYLLFARVARRLNPVPAIQSGVDPSASVHPDASVDPSAQIGANAVVERGARIEAGCHIGPGCVIGEGASIGENSWLHANVTVGYRVVVGRRAILHSGVVLGADGFGFANDSGRWEKVPQIGSVRLGDDVEIGANTCVDRGALGDTVIEDGVKLDNLIQVGHNVRIGAHTAIAACAAIAGSASIGRNCMIAGGAGVAGHLSIADGTMVTAMTAVTHSIKERGVYSGGTQMVPNHVWRKNAVRFSQLDDTVRRLHALERELAELKARLVEK